MLQTAGPTASSSGGASSEEERQTNLYVQEAAIVVVGDTHEVGNGRVRADIVIAR